MATANAAPIQYALERLSGSSVALKSEQSDVHPARIGRKGFF